MLAPLAFVLVLSFGVNRLSRTAVQGIFWAFCAAMGASLTSIFLAYSGESIVRTFFITAATFGAMSLVGYTTKRDLTGMGSFLMMGLFGVILASLVNMFVGSSGLAVHHQHRWRARLRGPHRLRHAAHQADLHAVCLFRRCPDQAGKRSVYDALSLYLNFINLFMLLLQLTGNRSSNN